MTPREHWKKETALFLTSQTLSILGTMLVQYAIMWHITLTTQSGVMMTISIVAGFIPTFILSPFAGVWADRFDRKRLIMLADFGIALTTLIATIIFWTGWGSLWILFAMSAVRAFGSAVQNPAVGAFLPQFVPEDQLMRVNGINGSIQSVIMLVSPMLSGALMTVAPLETIFMIDVVTAGLAIAVLYFLKVEPHARALEKGKVDYFGDLKDGINYVKNHPFIRGFFIFTAFFHVLITPVATLTPLQVTRTFGEDIWRLTAIEIAFSIGMLIGGLVMASWGGFRNRVHSMVLATFVLGLLTVALGIVPDFWVYLLIMGITGLTIPLFNTPATVLIQEKVEPNYLGRVFSVMAMIYSSTMPASMLFFGPLADVIDIEWMLIATGLLVFIQAFFLGGSKVMIKAGEPKVQEAKS